VTLPEDLSSREFAPGGFDVPPDFGPPGWVISGGAAQAGGLPPERFISSIGVSWPIALCGRISL
jgi:hypothetical protein